MGRYAHHTQEAIHREQGEESRRRETRQNLLMPVGAELPFFPMCPYQHSGVKVASRKSGEEHRAANAPMEVGLTDELPTVGEEAG